MSIRPRKRIETKLSQIKAYDTIIRPLVTEKSTMGGEYGQVSFVVFFWWNRSMLDSGPPCLTSPQMSCDLFVPSYWKTCPGEKDKAACLSTWAPQRDNSAFKIDSQPTTVYTSGRSPKGFTGGTIMYLAVLGHTF